jgi:DNA polymerase
VSTEPVSDASVPGTWEDLARAVEECRKCPLAQGRLHAVFGEGAADADLMFIGEGPGTEEDRMGRPFVGHSGELLTRMIAAMQFTREQVYIANIVKCHPPGNRNPRDTEAAACLPYLIRQIELVSPKILVLLGAVPLKILLELSPLTQHRGTWLSFRGIPTMPTFHPAFLLRYPKRKGEAWQDLQQVMLRLGKDPSLTPRGGPSSG